MKVFANRVLRRIFGPKREEVRGEWGKLRKEGLKDLYCSPIIVRVIKSRRMRWAGHAARWVRGKVYTGFGWGDLRECDHLEDTDVSGMILKWIFRN